MNNLVNLVFRVLLITALMWVTIEAHGAYILNKCRVVIENSIQHANVDIHCFSGDDELGDHTLASGQTFSFHFRMNLLGSTAFFCSFDTNYGSGGYEVFSSDLSEFVCDKYCHWFIEKNGPCLQHSDKWHEPVCFPWNR